MDLKLTGKIALVTGSIQPFLFILGAGESGYRNDWNGLGPLILFKQPGHFEMSVEEFLAWERAIDIHGVPGLRVTRLQIYRDQPPSQVAKPRC
jgi:hypothetical protein